MSKQAETVGPNARFWVRTPAGGWAKLTLSPGEEVEHWTGASTDEGWRSEASVYAYDGYHLTRSVSWRERDCDGLCSGYDVDACDLTKLRAREPYALGDTDYEPTPGAKLPLWQSVECRERDYAAEKAGY